MTTYVNASCHCGSSKFKVAFTTTSLPIEADTCHCNTCRHASGQMGYSVIRIEGVPLSHESNEPADTSKLAQYQTSNNVVRCFCGTCSAQLFWHVIETDPHWSVAIGILERVKGIFSMTSHIFVEDTLDGGLADHYRFLNGVEIPRYIGFGKDVVPVGWRADILRLKEEAKDEPLILRCHCQANVFHIIRSKEISSEERSGRLFQENEGKLVKFRAWHCVCDSCRLTSGLEIQSWAAVATENLIDPATSARIDVWDDSKRPTNLTQYQSTPTVGISREFCGTCGATLFHWRKDQQGVINVSVGVVDETQAGARADNWFQWHNEVMNADIGFNTQTVKDLGEGLNASG